MRASTYAFAEPFLDVISFADVRVHFADIGHDRSGVVSADAPPLFVVGRLSFFGKRPKTVSTAAAPADEDALLVRRCCHIGGWWRHEVTHTPAFTYGEKQYFLFSLSLFFLKRNGETCAHAHASLLGESRRLLGAEENTL